jgi:hypothetical protein
LDNNNIIVRLATSNDKQYAETITQEMEESAKARGTGIAKRTPEYVQRKMDEGKAVIALTRDGTWVGFCYIEEWDQKKFVANSGLIVSPPYRQSHVATEIKKKTFELSKEKYPEAKIFGLTTGLAVMKINSSLGYKPVTYSELTNDDEFWKGCRSCVNYDILMAKQRKNCICTAMLYDPATSGAKAEPVTVVTQTGVVRRKRKREFKGNFRLFERWVKFKRFVLLKSKRNGDKKPSTGNVLFKFFFW